MKTKALIEEVISLPVEARAMLAGLLLKSLNPAESDIAKQWVAIAKKRLNELRTGKAKTVPGDEVLKKIQDRFPD